MVNKKRGRPKITKKKQVRDTKLEGKTEPTNKVILKGMIRDNKVQEFVDRGSTEQKYIIKKVLIFLKLDDREMFDEVNGKNLLKQLKR